MSELIGTVRRKLLFIIAAVDMGIPADWACALDSIMIAQVPGVGFDTVYVIREVETLDHPASCVIRDA
jgi:hypothetical protein